MAGKSKRKELTFEEWEIIQLDENQLREILRICGFDMSRQIQETRDIIERKVVFYQEGEKKMKKEDENMITVDLTELCAKQEVLDRNIFVENDIPWRSKIREKVRALKVEIGEAVNVWAGFKYWKKTRPNWQDVDPEKRDELLEEYVDGIHFFLSLMNDLDMPTIHDFIEIRKDVFEQLDSLEFHLTRADEPLSLMIAFAYYRGLAVLWGFDWEEDVVPMYYRKWDINVERQNKGY